jgi:DNA-directed RNA polymerase subunit RPC12/RpoP
MAIKASCEYCHKKFIAPEQYRGKKIECPACKRKFVLKTDEDLDAERKEAEASQKRKEEDQEKLALIEKIDSRGQHRSGRPYYEEFQTGQEGVRHFNPRLPSRFSGLRELSDYLVIGAYVEILLVSLGIGLVIYLRIIGLIQAVSLLFLFVVIWLVVGTGLFLLLKYLGELAFFLADVGDQQRDTVQLLHDLRDSTDLKRE